MKFLFNKIPEDKNFNPRDGWITTNKCINRILSVLVLCLNVLIVICLFKIFNLNLNILNHNLSGNVLWAFITFIIIVIPIHEILHALFCPCKLTSNNLYLGIIPKKLIFFTYYSEIISKKRYVIVSIMPFLIITILGIFLAKLFPISNIFKILILYNATGSCMDILNALIALFRVPRNAVIKNKGTRLYWKL